MPERKPLLLLITTLVVVALAVGGVAIFMLYRAALGEERERLLAVARAEARLIDAVARVPSGADTDQWDETLRDIVAEQRGGSVLGEGGQLSVVRRRGADIEVLGLGTAGATTQMPWSAAETDPYRRVLEGEPGTAVMRAADGEWRLYAYEPIARLEAGVVAAIALDEVQQPFVRAGMAAAWAGAVLIALGTVVLVRVVQPLLVRLREREELYRTLAEFASDCVYWRDPHGAIVYMSPACEVLTGYSVAEFRERPELFNEMVYPEDREHWLGHDHVALADGGPDPIEFRIVTKGGEVRWVSHVCRPVYDAAGRFVGIRGSNRDVSSYHAAVERLERSERLLRRAQHMGEIGGWELDPQRQMFIWTDEAYRVHGVEDTFVPAFEAVMALYAEEARERLAAAFERGLGAAQPFDEILALRAGNAAPRWLRVVGEPQTSDGRVMKLVGMVRDVTDERAADLAAQERRELLEDEVRRRTAEYERSNAELEQFAYVASHDLQEPLRMVSSYCQLLQKRYQGRLDRDADEFIHFAVDGARRMQEMIQDLLTYSRVGRRAQAMERTNTGVACDKAIANLHATINEAHAMIVRDELPDVLGGSSRLVQLFQNLIHNGIKFRGAEPPRIFITVEQRGNEWEFAIRDNGIGIDAAHQERVFQIFQRLHARAEYPGTGVGLAICRKIVQQHGGRIWVESEPNVGATFKFTIPCLSEESDGQAEVWTTD